MINKAYEEGLKLPWWKDWLGDCVAIVAGGPSIKMFDLSILKDRIHTIAIKTAIDLCPWAEVVYGCDDPWWLDRKGLPNYKGLKLSHGYQITSNPVNKVHKVEIVISRDDILVDKPLQISNGGNSGHQAINLAVQFGATDIILVGYDLHERGGVHWYGRNKWNQASNPMQSNYQRWNKGFDTAAKSLKALDVTVMNASMESELRAFPKKPLQQIMEEWGL